MKAPIVNPRIFLQYRCRGIHIAQPQSVKKLTKGTQVHYQWRRRQLQTAEYEHQSDERLATNTPPNVEKDPAHLLTPLTEPTLLKVLLNLISLLISIAAAFHTTPVRWVIIVNRCSTMWWLAGQINVTGSGYKHAQRRAVTAHARPAICPALLPSVRSAAVYTSDSIYSARPCRLFAADQSHFLASFNLRLCTVWFSGAFGWGGAGPCAPVALVSQEQKVKMLKHL